MIAFLDGMAPRPEGLPGLPRIAMSLIARLRAYAADAFGLNGTDTVAVEADERLAAIALLVHVARADIDIQLQSMANPKIKIEWTCSPPLSGTLIEHMHIPATLAK